MRDSLVICTAGRPNELERCLASVASQAVLPEEILVVDASSDDVTAKLVDRLAAAGSLPALRWIAAPRGLTVQRNCALRVVTGEVVHFLDDDVEVCPEYFQRILETFAATPDGRIAGVGGIVTNARPNRRRWLYRLLQLEGRAPGAMSLSGVNTPFEGDPAKPNRVDWLVGCSMSYRRSTIEGFAFNESLTGTRGEDVDFSTAVGARALLLIAPGAYVVHHESPVNREAHLIATRDDLLRRHKIAVRRHPIAGRVTFWYSVGAQLALLAVASMRRQSVEPLRACRALAAGTADICKVSRTT